MAEHEGVGLTTRLLRVLKDDSGQDLIEYGLLIGVITVASLLAITAIGGKVVPYFANLNAAMP
jgi:pilus assembly protein Flp/PilA